MASPYDGYYDEDGNWHDPAASPDVNNGPPVDYPNTPVTPPGGYPPQAPEETAPPPTAPPPTTPPPGGGGGQFGGSFTAPDWMGIPGAPEPNLPSWKGPPAFAYDDFAPPSPEEAKSDPGYQFRVGQGLDALQRWAAARGTLNDSGTANALVDYGQNSATQEYSNVLDRKLNTYRTNRGNALDTYNTNYTTQYVDPYKFSYQSALDMNAPRVQTWQANVASTNARNDWAQREAWDNFMREYDQWKFNAGNELAG